MTKTKDDNKQAKKPKPAPDAVRPPVPKTTTQGAMAVASLNKNKKW